MSARFSMYRAVKTDKREIDLHKIVIVEDDQAVREMYELKFAQSEFWVKTADNGLNGFKLIKKFQPDLLFMDITLPLMNGIETLEKLLRLDNFKRPKIVISSNLNETHARKQLEHLDIDHFLIKAEYTPSEVLQLASRMLGVEPAR